MASTFNADKTHLENPGTGDYVGAWGPVVNGNNGVVGACFGGTTSLTLSNANVNLNQAQMQVYRILLTGTLSASVSVNFLSAVPGFFSVDNRTTGAYTVTVKTAAGGSTGVIAPQGYRSFVFSDGTNVTFCDDGASATYTPPGAIMAFAMSTAPSGWLMADGSAVSRSTYARLYANIGTTWGVGDGVTTFNLPNFQGAFLRGWDNGRGLDPGRAFASYQVDALGSHTHTITDPGHLHGETAFANVSLGGSGVNTFPGSGGTGNFNTKTATTGITATNASGSTETTVKNYAIIYCIRT